jgi:peptide/nickel transport system ATP-binding protein
MLRALLLDPVFLFADKPTSRLDPITAQSVSQLLVDMARETEGTVMLVSHDPHLIEKRCDRVIRISA